MTWHVSIIIHPSVHQLLTVHPFVYSSVHPFLNHLSIFLSIHPSSISIIAFITSSDRDLISDKIDSIGRLLSLPRVKGTIQKLHILSQPRITDLQRKEVHVVHDTLYWLNQFECPIVFTFIYLFFCPFLFTYTNAVGDDWFNLTGTTSAYVSSNDNNTFTTRNHMIITWLMWHIITHNLLY